MCNCEEIQGHKFKIGDFALNLNHGFDEWTGCVGDNKCFLYDDSIWLPRQDQLQDMMLKEDYIKGWRNLQNCFYDWLVDCNERMYKFGSMEQMWLAYYMESKHTALWTGTEWDRAQWTDKEAEEMERRE